jgi:hypothetical protein
MNLTSFQQAGKTVGFILFLLVVLGITIFLGKNASGLLTAKASGCPAAQAKAVQITANGAVINWTTSEASQGRVEYGTDIANLTYSQIEGSEETNHNVPLTLLTPKTVYYYVIKIGSKKCDNSGNPWTFSTVGAGQQLEKEITPTVASTSGSLIPSPTMPSVATKSANLSTICSDITKNMGKNPKSPDWATVKKYDLDANSIINARDIIKCEKDNKK